MESIRTKIVLALGAVLLVVMAAGIAAALQAVQEVTGSPSFEEGKTGPPFLGNSDWQPGTPGPPPWAGAKDGDTPPRLAHPDWKPGTPGPPPWAGADEDS